MKVVEYQPEYAERLSLALKKAGAGPLLRRESYLNHYYLGHSDCRLWLLLEASGDVAATLGSEAVQLRIGDRRYRAHVGSNTYSLREGAFALLFLHWMRSCELGVMIPVNARWNAMLAKQARWQSIPGLRTYFLNWGYPIFDSDPLWKRRLKPLVRCLRRVDPEALPERIAKARRGDLTVVEERAFSKDMLDRRGSFGLRLDPDIGYLNWRFSTNLDYVRYRIFRVLRADATRGFVVLGDWPNCLIVAHCDGDDPEELAYGVVLAVSAANRGNSQRYRKVLLATMHREMASVFCRFGFRPKKTDTPFYISAFRAAQLPLAPGSDWLLNMDWADFGLEMGTSVQ